MAAPQHPPAGARSGPPAVPARPQPLALQLTARMRGLLAPAPAHFSLAAAAGASGGGDDDGAAEGGTGASQRYSQVPVSAGGAAERVQDHGRRRRRWRRQHRQQPAAAGRPRLTSCATTAARACPAQPPAGACVVQCPAGALLTCHAQPYARLCLPPISLHSRLLSWKHPGPFPAQPKCTYHATPNRCLQPLSLTDCALAGGRSTPCNKAASLPSEEPQSSWCGGKWWR